MLSGIFSCFSHSEPFLVNELIRRRDYDNALNLFTSLWSLSAKGVGGDPLEPGPQLIHQRQVTAGRLPGPFSPMVQMGAVGRWFPVNLTPLIHFFPLCISSSVLQRRQFEM